MLLGVALRVWQYLAHASLWIDEAALARNVIERPTAALLQPLDYAQVAPPGFLLVEKGIVALFGPSEFALRLFPLFCGFAALVVFWRLAFTVLEDWAAPYAVGLLAIGSPFVYFSSHVKQYSSDILCALLMTWTAVWMRRVPERLGRAAVLGAVGAAVVWFSQPAVIVAAGTGLALLACALSERRPARFRSLLVVGVPWVISAGAASLLAMSNVTPMDRAYFEWFWAAGFWPWPPQSLQEIFWPFNQLTLVFGTFMTGPRRTNGGLNYPWSMVFAVVVLIGCVAFWKSRRDVALLIVTPAIVALAASGLSLYPFTGRVMVFLLPNFILALAGGARFLLSTWPRRLAFATPVALALLGGAPIYAAATALPPERIEHLRPVLADVAKRLDPGDTIYVHHSAGQAFLYYAPRFNVRLDVSVIGRCSSEDPRGYLRQVDRFRGSRVWIIGTHLYYPAAAFQWITDYLEAIGQRKDSIVVEASTKLRIHGAYAFLYDLSDRQRLGSASAESFALPARPLHDPEARMACHGVESALGEF